MIWLYLWPVLAACVVLVLVAFAALAGVNLVLGLLVISLYGLFPKETLFDSIRGLLQSEEIEKNIQATFQLHVQKRLPPTSIFIWQPHGLISISSVFFNSLKICTHPEYTPNHAVTMPFFHYVPVLGDIARYLGSIPSDYRTIEKTLEKKESISIMLGGIREMITSDPFTIRLFIKKRRGIFRLALTTGTPIVPVLTYGENELFQPLHNAYVDALNDFLYKTFGLYIPFTTRETLQNWVQLSKKPLKPIHSYTGQPIHVTQIDNPSDEDIDTLRSRYIRRMKNLFKKTATSQYTLVIE